MKKKKITHKKYKFTYIKVTVATLFLCLLGVRGYTSFVRTGENLFHIQVNGQDVGALGDKSRIDDILLQARKNVAAVSSELVFMDSELTVIGEEVIWGEVDEEQVVMERMEEILRASIHETLRRSYTLKISEYTINLASIEDVRQLLQAAIDKYGNEGKFSVDLKFSPDREFNVLDANVVEVMEAGDGEGDIFSPDAGVQTVLSEINRDREPDEPKDFEEYELGIQKMGFLDTVEVVEVYLPESQLTDLEEAIQLVIMEQETPSIYTVVSGDTLTAISMKVDIPMETIVEMNDNLESVNSILHIGDELLITVPEPELSVTRVEQEYLQETYEAEIEYIDNNSWYTTKSVVLQEPHAGFRRVIVDVSYINDKEVGREILKEEVVMPAVAKVVERGTIIPPTYIKPIYGGRLTSYFGWRKKPNAAANANHTGVDWATSTGTPVYASSAGTVTRAGWLGTYGYVVFIDHPDGKQTRYAHLSRVQVSVGQKVKQGDRIALSGNTGNSTGPHLHFEMLVNGVRVDPLNYVPK